MLAREHLEATRSGQTRTVEYAVQVGGKATLTGPAKPRHDRRHR